MPGIALMLIPEDTFEFPNLHLTLGFFGDTENARGMMPFVDLGQRLIESELAPEGKINGIGIFNLPDGYATVALVDSQSVELLRYKLQRVIDIGSPYRDLTVTPIKSDHGFIPHMTLKITPKVEFSGKVSPIMTRPVKFDRLRVGYGDKYTDLWFEGYTNGPVRR